MKEELTRIPVWVKLHGVPLQVFNEDGISIIATHIGTPIMLDSFTSSMCIDSWGRRSFFFWVKGQRPGKYIIQKTFKYKWNVAELPH
jgi:hypothetical protein